MSFIAGPESDLPKTDYHLQIWWSSMRQSEIIMNEIFVWIDARSKMLLMWWFWALNPTLNWIRFRASN